VDDVIARFGNFHIDSASRQLERDGKPIHLTPQAFDFLLLLIEQAPRIVRKDEMHARLWPDTFVVDATLVSVVKEVRRALGDHASTSPVIRTAHRVGYGFAVAVERNVGPGSTLSRWLMVGRRRISLAGLEPVIGRDPASDIYIDAPGVSRRHARIILDRENAVLEDLGSKNGTAVNGQPLEGRVALKDGDQVRLGQVIVLYRSSTRGESTETVARIVPGAASRARRRSGTLAS
jgi:DNA-binding winged helix-turn-helix (wHTH) protein